MVGLDNVLEPQVLIPGLFVFARYGTYIRVYLFIFIADTSGTACVNVVIHHHRVRTRVNFKFNVPKLRGMVAA